MRGAELSPTKQVIPSPIQSAECHELTRERCKSRISNEGKLIMGELIIMGIGFDRPTVTLPMTATKEEIVGAIVATTQEEETETGK